MSNCYSFFFRVFPFRLRVTTVLSFLEVSANGESVNPEEETIAIRHWFSKVKKRSILFKNVSNLNPCQKTRVQGHICSFLVGIIINAFIYSLTISFILYVYKQTKSSSFQKIFDVYLLKKITLSSVLGSTRGGSLDSTKVFNVYLQEYSFRFIDSNSCRNYFLLLLSEDNKTECTWITGRVDPQTILIFLMFVFGPFSLEVICRVYLDLSQSVLRLN